MGNTSNSKRFNELISVLEWLHLFGGATVGEIGRVFNFQPDHVVELLELASCCGVTPFTPDSLLEVWIDFDDDGEDDIKDAVVHAKMSDFFDQQEITEERLSYIASVARTLLQLPGLNPDEPLMTALEKLKKFYPARILVDFSIPKVVNQINSSIDLKRPICLEYFSNYENEFVEKVIVPLDIKFLDGKLYVDGYDLEERINKRFRADRVIDVIQLDDTAVTSDTFPNTLDEAKAFSANENKSFEVVILIPSKSSWLLDAVEIKNLDQSENSSLKITFDVMSVKWLERILLLAGPGTKVLSPAYLRDLPGKTAKRLLKKYQE